MFLSPRSELRHKSERNDPNYSSTFSFHCKANPACVRTLEKIMGTVSDGNPKVYFKAEGDCQAGSFSNHEKVVASAVILGDI